MQSNFLCSQLTLADSFLHCNGDQLFTHGNSSDGVAVYGDMDDDQLQAGSNLNAGCISDARVCSVNEDLE